jgi:hypothetical protein
VQADKFDVTVRMLTTPSIESRATDSKIEGKQGILKQRLKTLDGWVARLGRRGQGRRKEREKER